MKDTTIKKVNRHSSPEGEMGQQYLVAGVKQALRYWNEEPGEDKEPRSRAYETVGYVIQGKAELHLEGQKVTLEPGDAWLVPEGAEHSYKVLERFEAVESTSPPARVDDRDKA